MATAKPQKDVHIPSWTLNNFIRRQFGKPHRYDSEIIQGQVVADLGCGPGFFTFPLADRVGPTGKVYAVDSDPKAIRVIERKAAKGNYQHIETHAGSAAKLDFITDGSVDFVLADGLLCCVAPQDHTEVVNEIKRVLKSEAKAYLVSGRSNLTYMNDSEWEVILKEFNVLKRNHPPYKGDRWAWVKKL